MTRKVSVLICMVVTFLLCFSPAFATEYRLRLQTYYSPSTAAGAKYFAEQVKKNTGGKVEVQVFTGGELIASANILKSVRNGMIEMGQGMGHHFSELKTGTIESGLPMSWMSATEATLLYDERGLRTLIGKEYEKAGVVYLGPTWAASYHTVSKQPIRSLDDMRKMKVRVVGATAKMLASLGVNVVAMPPEDIYMALTTGQIDAVVYGNAAEYKETKFYEVAPYINITPLINPITDTLIINKKIWNEMPSDIRIGIQAAADQTRWYWYSWGENESLKVLSEIFKDKVTTFSEADQKELVKAAVAVWEQEAGKSPEAEKGVKILKDFAQAMGRLE